MARRSTRELHAAGTFETRAPRGWSENVENTEAVCGGGAGEDDAAEDDSAPLGLIVIQAIAPASTQQSKPKKEVGY
jgi:hypothetical protein